MVQQRRAGGLRPARVGVLGQGPQRPPGRGGQQQQRVLHRGGRPVGQAPHDGRGQRGLQLLRGPAEVGDVVRTAPGPAGGGGRGMNRGHGHLPRQGSGHPVEQVVALVDHHHVVLREGLAVLGGVDGEHRVVGHHDVHLARADPRGLAEALPHHRAALPETLPGRHRHRAPGAVRHPRHQVVPVAGARAAGPLPGPGHLLLQGGPGPASRLLGLPQRQRVLLGLAAAREPVGADVVVATLDQLPRGSTAERALQRIGQPGQVLAHQLSLQGQGARRDDDATAPPEGGSHRRDQVPPRLARARPGLHQQVRGVVDRLRDGGRHAVLALAPGASCGLDHPGEEGDGLHGVVPLGHVLTHTLGHATGVVLGQRFGQRFGQGFGHGFGVGSVGPRLGVGPVGPRLDGHLVRRAAHPRDPTARGPARPGRPSPGPTGQAWVCEASVRAAARALSTRACSRVPSATCSTSSTSPSAWVRLTRSPRP